jgi:hypothetical protein
LVVSAAAAAHCAPLVGGKEEKAPRRQTSSLWSESTEGSMPKAGMSDMTRLR